MINDDYYAVWFYDNNNYNGLYGYILFIQAMISFDCDGNLFMLYFFFPEQFEKWKNDQRMFIDSKSVFVCEMWIFVLWVLIAKIWPI